MIHPRIDSLLDHVDSHYAAVIVAAKRARQINNYYHTLGEGVFEEFPPPMVETPSKNYLTIALEEVAQGKINSRYRGSRTAPRQAIMRRRSAGRRRTGSEWQGSCWARAAASPPTRRSSSRASP